ncbi:peptide deformylase, partial [Candidatus Uhrbacteria bacterium]|nr:peptide deformylase [Candidatus Uhrbacteria bacterium]
MIHQILTDPHPTLRARATEIPPEKIATPELQTLIDDMIET